MFRYRLDVALMALLCAAPAGAQSSTSPQDEITSGIALVEGGDFERGIMVLGHAVRSLEGTPQSRERARAYVYLGIAYLGLAQMEAAKQRFRDALGEAGDLKLSADEFPPKVVDLFEQARREMADDAASARGPIAGVGVGGRVRLWNADGDELHGTVLSMDTKSITLAAEHGAQLTVRHDSIARLEVAVGRRGHTLKGLLIGGGLGLIIAFSPVDPEDCGSDSLSYCSRGDAVGTGLLIAGAGALVGTLIKSDRWVSVTLAATPTGRGAARTPEIRLGLRLRF